MLQPLKRHPLYFSMITIAISTSFIFSLLATKTESFVLLNGFHRTWLDLFFKYYTFLGDGIITIAFVLLCVLLGKKKKAAALLLGYLSSGLIVQALKRLFYFPRPKVYLESISYQYMHFVTGTTLQGSNSFPSGHTASAFCFITVLILIFKKQKICIPCFIFAILVAYSRIYLAQHFLQDVAAGAFLGVIFGMLSYYCIYNQKALKQIKRLYKRRKYSRSENPKANLA